MPGLSANTPNVHSRPRNVLILDDLGTPSVIKRVNYSDFVSSNEVRLFIITSRNALSDKDKSLATEHVELSCPTTDGSVEIIAKHWHDKYTLHDVYTKQEDLILRASYLRQLLGISSGLQPSQALAFRDKEVMKNVVMKSNIPVPPFARVFSPSCVISFIQQHGFPVVVKPTLGSASSGVKVLKNWDATYKYLSQDFFSSMDTSGRRMDLSGEMIIEKFINGKMYHVNGYARNGKLIHAWCFQYIQTNLGFTQGNSYGNILIPVSDPRYKPLVKTTTEILKSLPTPENLVFHLELFEVQPSSVSQLWFGTSTKRAVPSPNHPVYALCEIAARRPGGSISILMEQTMNIPFARAEFRLNLGLPLLQPLHINDSIVGDLLVPLKAHHRLTHLPASCPVDGVTYIPIAKVGTEYTGFDITNLNTCARFFVRADSKYTSFNAIESLLKTAESWFQSSVQYEPLSPSPSVLQNQIISLRHNAQPVNVVIKKVVRSGHKAYASARALTRIPKYSAKHTLLNKVTRKMTTNHEKSMQLVKFNSRKTAGDKLVNKVFSRYHGVDLHGRKKRSRISRLTTQFTVLSLRGSTSTKPQILLRRILRKSRFSPSFFSSSRSISSRRNPIVLPFSKIPSQNLQLSTISNQLHRPSNVLLRRIQRNVTTGFGKRVYVVGKDGGEAVECRIPKKVSSFENKNISGSGSGVSGKGQSEIGMKIVG